jgi:predicted nucleic acid-binding protein
VAEILDAYALVALIVDEPAAEIVDELVRPGDAAITSVNLGEAVDVSCRVHGLDEAEVVAALEPMLIGGQLTLIAPGATVAWRAAHLRISHYGRRTRPVSMADCFLLAAAGTGDRVATADPAVAEVARAEGIEVVALPDSSGHRP